jgi:hypothetical protein
LETRLIYTLVRINDRKWDAEIGTRVARISTRVTRGVRMQDNAMLRQSFRSEDEADTWLRARAKSLRVAGPKVIAPTSVWLPFGDTGLIPGE